MEFKNVQQVLQSTRIKREESEQDLFKAKEKLGKLRRDKAQLLRFEGTGRAEVETRLENLKRRENELTATVDRLIGIVAENVIEEQDCIGNFFQFTDPTENISRLDDSYPVLLFPLRIETRFKQIDVEARGRQHQLWVRVFPDEISIDAFENLPSENEVRNARSYWSSIWRAGDVEDDQRAAWRSLVSNHGSGRAFWIVQNYLPVNAEAKPERLDKYKINLVIATDNPPDDGETTVLKTFWAAMWKAGDDNTRKTAALEILVSDLGDERAMAAVEEYEPFNFGDAPSPPRQRDEMVIEVVFIEFPKPDDVDTKYQAWTQAPKVNTLPERLVLLGFNQDRESAAIEVLGNPISPSLATGPDPSAEEGEKMRSEDGELVVDDEIKWMVDFDEAISKGMGFKIDLTPEQAETGFDRLFVLGVRIGADKDEATTQVETLLDHHHHSRKGLSILAQGTPTNNTETVDSSYSWREDSDDSFDIHFQNQRPDDPENWFEKKDGRWLAEMLGIDTKYLENVDNYYGTDQREARAMNVALWPATLGYFMETMMDPIFGERDIDQTKSFFQRYVSGRGAVPAIRVGKQPYGILTATPFSRMKWLRSRTHFTHLAVVTPVLGPELSYLNSLYKVLSVVDDDWTALVDKVSRVGNGVDAHKVLLDVVGLHPSSVEHYYRYAQSREQLYNDLNLKGLHAVVVDRLVHLYEQSAKDLLKRFGYTVADNEGMPDILSKFFFGRSDLMDGPLIDDVPLSESESLRYSTEDGSNYIEWLIDAARDSHNALRKQNDFLEGKPPTALLYLMLQHALDLGYHNASVKLHESAGVFSKQMAKAALQEPRFIHVQEGKSDSGSRWQHLYKAESRITSHDSMLVESYISTIIAERPETNVLRDQLKALELLKKAPTARLERAFVEHLDTCTYRFDSWMLGIVSAQLSLMRSVPPQDPEGEAGKGLYIGAYGWLEDVRSEDKMLTRATVDPDIRNIFDDPDRSDHREHPLMVDDTNGGYIHAPSTNHAVTAAVLRNGYLANATSETPTSLSVNLSSKRVRLALTMIEGIRSGQSLAALLGYQLERGMHDRSDVEVDSLILDLRKAFPLVSNRMSTTKDSDVDDIQEIEARNVIDGLALIEQIKTSGEKTYPFGKEGLEGASRDERIAINQEVVFIVDINDAVADLAIAESVHQAVQGNYDRAAATIDTYSKGHFPPTPDVVRTPRSGVTLTHRVGLQFDASVPPNGTTPRATAEPAINKWLSDILPPMDKVVCAIDLFDQGSESTGSETVNVKELGLQPIDLLYMMRTESEQTMTALDDTIVSYAVAKFTLALQIRIAIQYTRALENTPANSEKVTLFELSPLLESLRILIQTSRPLTPTDVKLAGEAKKAEEAEVSLDSSRITLVKEALNEQNNKLKEVIDTLKPLVDATDIPGLVDEIDALITKEAVVLRKMALFGLPQTGLGFLLEWKRTQFIALTGKLQKLITRWENKLVQFGAKIAEYDDLTGTHTDEERFALLIRAEREIFTSSTIALPASPNDFRDTLVNIKNVEFLTQLNSMKAILSRSTLKDLFTDIEGAITIIPKYDLAPLDIEQEKTAFKIFAEDMLSGAQNLHKDVSERLLSATAYQNDHDAANEPQAKVAALLEAGKRLLGEDFRFVPGFVLKEEHSDEWQNAWNNGTKLLKYQTDKLKEEFPVDGWLYGVARVREKMEHVENATVLLDVLTNKGLQLKPIQLPHYTEDYWLALEYPEKMSDDVTEFTIDEDKLLYTAYYAKEFVKTEKQCGLLLDEWTEVIPSKSETTGLAFHYDRPNSEPSQALLLVTPSEFKRSWQWRDLVDSLHETLDMAKKRAIEPEHIDATKYARFLPALLSAVTAYPITAALNLAVNNNLFKWSGDNNG